MDAEKYMLMTEIDRRISEAGNRDFETIMSIMRPLMAVVRAGLLSGAISVDDAIKLLPPGRNEDQDRGTIEQWANPRSGE
ncbi:hypothetical protein [Ruegeria sp.]|uniref:hypothetical protein n=1 Tax=Ruegeria sp. TaxID=1879320 RepID=UPI003B00BBA8